MGSHAFSSHFHAAWVGRRGERLNTDDERNTTGTVVVTVLGTVERLNDEGGSSCQRFKLSSFQAFTLEPEARRLPPPRPLRVLLSIQVDYCIGRGDNQTTVLVHNRSPLRHPRCTPRDERARGRPVDSVVAAVLISRRKATDGGSTRPSSSSPRPNVERPSPGGRHGNPVEGKVGTWGGRDT